MADAAPLDSPDGGKSSMVLRLRLSEFIDPNDEVAALAAELSATKHKGNSLFSRKVAASPTPADDDGNSFTPSQHPDASQHHGRAINYTPSIAHPDLAGDRDRDNIPASVLLKHSPFEFAARTAEKVSGSEPSAQVLARLAKAFVAVRFSRGDVIPPSPFYLVARGSVAARVIADGRVVCVKRAGAYLNWSSEFQRFSHGPLGTAILGMLPRWVPSLVASVAAAIAPSTLKDGREADPHALELIGASDGAVYVLTDSTMRAFMATSERSSDLIMEVAKIASADLPVVAKAELKDETLRSLSVVSSFRCARSCACLPPWPFRTSHARACRRGPFAPLMRVPAAVALSHLSCACLPPLPCAYAPAPGLPPRPLAPLPCAQVCSQGAAGLSRRRTRQRDRDRDARRPRPSGARHRGGAVAALQGRSALEGPLRREQNDGR